MPPLCKGRCRTDEGRLTEGLPLSREITLGTTTPQSACASQLPPAHRTSFSSRSGVPHGLFSFRTITPNGAPVFRSAYSASRNARASAAFAASIEAHCAVCRETRMLQVRCARPAPSHRNGFSSRSGVTVGLFSAKSTQYSLLQNARHSSSLRSPFGYRGAKLRVLMPPLCKGRCRTDEGRLTEGFPLLQNLPPERREARRRRASRQECGLRPAKGRGAHSCPPKPLGRKTHTTRTRRIT